MKLLLIKYSLRYELTKFIHFDMKCKIYISKLFIFGNYILILYVRNNLQIKRTYKVKFDLNYALGLVRMDNYVVVFSC